MRRVLLPLSAAVVFLTAVPAAAIGVNDVDMNVVAARGDDGRRAVHVADRPREISVVLRNLAQETRTVTLSIRSGTIDADTGSVGLGGDGSAAWLGVSPLDVTLEAGESRTVPVTIDPARVPGDSTVLAFVLSAPQGEVVTQAASIVRVTAERPPPPWALWLIALALLLLVGVAVGRTWRRQRRAGLPGEPALA